MGRIFETRKATMFARWNKMAKAFTRVSKEIVMAVKAGGPDPGVNSSLRRAIHNARALNMPRDKIEGAIKRAHEGKDTSTYEELIYEGYGPHGIACMVVTATDNPTRTVANIRSGFGRNGGNMGTSGSVSFAFKRMGVFRLDASSISDQETLELELIDHGLEEMGESDGEKGGAKIVVIRCAMESFGQMQAALEERKLATISAESEFVPLNMLTLPEDQATEVLKMVDALEQDDDVQSVFHNLG
jgi:YebC/PmpR family DNA-binding regulatory protein